MNQNLMENKKTRQGLDSFHLVKLPDAGNILKNFVNIRDRTLSMYEGGRSVFVGAMKHFRHILMGHEIFFKIFDGHKIFSYVLFS